MLAIFGVQFRSILKILYYNLNDVVCKKGDGVICKTKNGLEFGREKKK